MPYDYFFMIWFGLLFVGVGVCVFLVQRLNPKRDMVQRVIPIVVIIAGSALTVAAVFSPSPSKRRVLIAGVFHTPVANIDEIDIERGPDTRSTSLTTVPMAIRNRADISKFADALRHAPPFSPNHPQEKWSATITLRTKTSEYNFIVLPTSDDTNGTLITLSSKGWILGEYRCDELGDILERLVKAK